MVGLDLFSTRLSDPDDLSVFVPNAQAFGQIIVNQTSPAARRAQLDITIDYDDDVDRALELMLACAAADRRVVKTPAPWARLTTLKDNGLTVTLRVWFSPGDYWDGRFDLLKAVKDAFEQAGLSFPYPHQVAVQSRAFRTPGSKRAAASAKPAARKVAGARKRRTS